MPIGEDTVSYQRHIRALQVEFKKTRRNMSVVNELMTITFPFRRKFLMEGVHELKTIFEKFPFLQLADEVQYCCRTSFYIHYTFLS